MSIYQWEKHRTKDVLRLYFQIWVPR